MLIYKDKDADYDINIIVPHDGESKTIPYLAQVKMRISNTMLGSAAIQAKNSSEQLVLVSEYVAPAQAKDYANLTFPSLIQPEMLTLINQVCMFS